MVQGKKPRLTRDDLDARFTALQEKNRVRRETPVTREDVEKRLAERKAQRAQQRVPGRTAFAVSLGVGLALIAGSGILALTTTAGTNAFNLSTHVNEQRIASVTGDLSKIPAASDASATQYSAELEKQIAEATTKAEAVASLQQEFTSILFRGNAEASSDGAPRTAFRDSVEHRRLLAPYFVDRALLADESLAYTPGSVLPFGSDEIDPRFPWYVGTEPGSEGRIVVDPSVSSWELRSLVATSTQGVLEATWLNTSPTTGELYAWATASYYVDPGAFGNLTVGKTTIGDRGVASASKGGE